MLNRAVSSLLKPLREVAEGGLEVKFRGGEIRSCFRMLLLYCCNITEAKDISGVRHGAGNRQPCVRCHRKYVGRVRGGKSSSRLVPATVNTRRKEREKQAEAAGLRGRGSSTRKQQAQRELADLPSKQSLPEGPPFLENMCAADEVVARDFYLIRLSLVTNFI